MLLYRQITDKRNVNLICKIILFFLIFLIIPGFFRLLDHIFQLHIGLNRYINMLDFIFLIGLFFCLFNKNKIKEYLSIPSVLCICYIFLGRISLFLSEGQIHHKAFYDLFKASLALVLFFVFLTPFFLKNQKNLIKSFLVIFFTVALFQSIVGIMQFLLQRPLGLTLLNEPLFGVNIETSAKIFISEGKHFFINKIIPNQGNYFLRAHGTFLHPNVFSGFLNVSCLFTLFLIYKSKKKFVYSLFLLIELAALIFTFSRAGLASFVCSSFLFFLLMFVKKYDIKKMFLIFLSCFFLLAALFSKYLVERGFIGKVFQSNKAKEMNLNSSNVRFLLKDVSIEMIKKHPFFGIGFRNFLIKRDEYSTQRTERAYVHNIYLLIASETGLVALFIFVSLITLIFARTIAYCLNPFNIVVLSIIVSFLIIGFFDHYPISTYFGRVILFACLGFLNYSTSVNKPFSCIQKASLYL